MCGIIGYVGGKETCPLLYNALKRVEYRGYDSAGIAIIDSDVLVVSKTLGTLDKLEELLAKKDMTGQIGIGHTRWATHGKPLLKNAHPHIDELQSIAVVHNGIIENHQELREMLEGNGYKFSSDTDSEIIPNLIKFNYSGDLVEAVQKTVSELKGLYAFAVLALDAPDTIIAVKNGAPLILGIGINENFIASDVNSILEHTNRVIYLNEGDIAAITKDSVKIYEKDSGLVTRTVEKVDFSLASMEKGPYEYFMLKEIDEQPMVLKRLYNNYVNDTEILFKDLNLSDEYIQKLQRISVIGCGSAYHSALVFKNLVENLLNIPVDVQIASEFRYNNIFVTDDTLFIAVSQSGETADTLAAASEVKKRGGRLVSLVNVMGSTLCRVSEGVIDTKAGIEVGVASTKAFISQLFSFYLLALYIGKKKTILSEPVLVSMLKDIERIPDQLLKFLNNELVIKGAKFISESSGVIFIGRGINYPIALEGALKLRELSYIYAQGLQGGELKHGSIALVDSDTPTIALAVKSNTYDKMINSIEEIKARDGSVITVSSAGDERIGNISTLNIEVPNVDEMFSPFFTTVAMQLLAYYVTVMKGFNVDKPRNLAKSVTVE